MQTRVRNIIELTGFMAFVDLRFLQYLMISYGVGFVLEELEYGNLILNHGSWRV
jgi:hypothetical protein